tara:strand:- start:445 stop:708 length:264 start_codon:yes stop_codon:yes gene_type:complete
MNLTMEKVADYIKEKLKQRKERKETRKKLIFKLVKNDHKCRQLRMQLAKKNTKALSRQEYLINEDKVKQIIYLTLQQLKIRNTLNYD